VAIARNAYLVQLEAVLYKHGRRNEIGNCATLSRSPRPTF